MPVTSTGVAACPVAKRRCAPHRPRAPDRRRRPWPATALRNAMCAREIAAASRGRCVRRFRRCRARAGRTDARAVQHRHQRLDRDRRRVVLVLPDECDDLAAPRSTSAAGNAGRMTMSATSPSTSSKSSTRQVHASDSAWRLTEAVSEYAAAVELLGDLVGRVSLGAAVDGSRHEMRDAAAAPAGRSTVPAARCRMQRHRRCRRRSLGEHA